MLGGLVDGLSVPVEVTLKHRSRVCCGCSTKLASRVLVLTKSTEKVKSTEELEVHIGNTPQPYSIKRQL